MDKFYIITNRKKDPDLAMTKIIQNYLLDQGKQCLAQEQVKTADKKGYKYTDVQRIPEDVECVLVLGGDGTLLQASRDLMERDIPLMGVNLGTLGYLAEIDSQNILPALDKLILDEYVLESRMMVKGSAIRKGECLLQDIALNDIVISRDGRLRIIDFNIYVNGAFLNSYSADGIIISTPTGSTGYSLSAGGPIISPEASLIMLTPIAPHTLNTRSIVLPDDVNITIEIGKEHTSSRDGAVATFDGDTFIRLCRGDQVVISKAAKSARLVKINNISFLEVLREKMSNQ